MGGTFTPQEEKCSLSLGTISSYTLVHPGHRPPGVKHHRVNEMKRLDAISGRHSTPYEGLIKGPTPYLGSGWSLRCIDRYISTMNIVARLDRSYVVIMRR